LENIKISIDNNGEKLQLELPQDTDINGWVNTFKVILKWLTFADNTIEEMFGKEIEDDD